MMSISHLDGVYLTLDDARWLSEALDSLIAALPRNGQRPTARLETSAAGLRKAVARASDPRFDTSSDASFQRLHRVSPDNDVHAVMSAADAAKVLGISANGVRDLCRRGTLRACLVGRSWAIDARSVVERSER